MINIASDIVPPAEEAKIRLELAQELQGIIRKASRQADWRFTASHLSAIFVMPMDILREIASSGRVSGTGSGCGALALNALDHASYLTYMCKLPSFEIFLHLIANNMASSFRVNV